MGLLKHNNSTVLPVSLDSHGTNLFNSIVKQHHSNKTNVYTQYTDLVPKILGEDINTKLEDEEDAEIEKTKRETEAFLKKIINEKLSCVTSASTSNVKFIKYKPSQKTGERLVKMMEKPVDPLEPCKFRHKKIPKNGGEPPVPVLHSPLHPSTVKDQQDWKIQPCISNWKNLKGYTIPLDMRVISDGRGLEEAKVSDRFAEFADAMESVEKMARKAIHMWQKVEKELRLKVKERKERELIALARKDRAERNNETNGTMVEKEECLNRERIREDRRRERKRASELEARNAASGKKSRITRDGDRDIGERVARGMANTGIGRGGEITYDQRLFNQDQGMHSGFAVDDQYNIYDKKMHHVGSVLSGLFRPQKDLDAETYGDEDHLLEKIPKTNRFKPHKGFSDAGEGAGARDELVEFEKEADKGDIFGLDKFMASCNVKRK